MPPKKTWLQVLRPAAFLILCFPTEMSKAQPQTGAPAPPGTFSLDRDREPVIKLDGLWRFHPGDDPDGRLGWARADFDDSSWTLIASEGGWSDQGFRNMSGLAWYRARVFVEDDSPLSLYIPDCYTNYEVYADGQRIGGLGSMPPHALAYVSTPVLLDLPHLASKQPHAVLIGIRVWLPADMSSYVSGGLNGDALMGKTPDIHRRVAMLDRARAWRWAGLTSVAVLGTLIGTASLVLFLLRRREKEYLWFGISMIFYSSYGLLNTHVRFHPWSYRWHDLTVQIASALSELAAIAFYFHLLRGTRNWFFWLAVASSAVFVLFFCYDFGLLGNLFTNAQLNTIATLQSILMSIWILALLIRRAKEGVPDSRLLLGPVLLQQLANDLANAFNVFEQAGWIRQEPDWINKSLQWPFPISIRAIADAVFILAILGVLIYRFTRTRQHEEKLSNELEAARTVQQVLIPAEIPPIPGFAMESIYLPASQVGGDFFQIIPLPSGGALVVIGDVSGKGMPAAMTVALLVGTIRTLAHFTEKPGEILAAMNQRMLARSKGGFTTCLAIHAAADGTITLANAGHIPPYLGEREISVEYGLPLGLAAESDYPESKVQLREGDRVTVLTDGVVEARSKDGDLFGFDRTAAISKGSAEAIARTAREFGQEDDITVLTITRTTQPMSMSNEVIVLSPSLG
jgi:Stage II sporulation protein E (SpoIIE)/7TM diverse intracellular signalling